MQIAHGCLILDSHFTPCNRTKSSLPKKSSASFTSRADVATVESRHKFNRTWATIPDYRRQKKHKSQARVPSTNSNRESPKLNRRLASQQASLLKEPSSKTSSSAAALAQRKIASGYHRVFTSRGTSTLVRLAKPPEPHAPPRIDEL